METIYDIKSLRRLIREWKRADEKIALVPTMGNLHAGHLSLLSHARGIAGRTVVSIFVNPIQFGRGEDYEHYPSTLDADKEKLEHAGVDLVFAPNLKELYPGGITKDTRVTVPAISDILCGEFRPGHFAGVTTVVIKLLNNVQPDFALFGEKDYQQVLVIRRMVHDLLIPVEIIALPIIREDDGLAMSSRNNYLTPELRQYAAIVYESLNAAAKNLKSQRTTIPELEAACREAVEQKGMRLEYVSVRRSEDLAPAAAGDWELIILMAVWLGKARLIDNVQVLLEAPLRGTAV